jgi:hypothetical protein
MRPPIDGRAINILRETVPEFENHYLELLDLFDEDLTPQVVFNELAEFVSAIVSSGEGEDSLGRCVAAVELVALAPGADGTGLVAFCFLDQLASFALEAIREDLGDLTKAILGLLEEDLLYEDDDGEIALLISDRLTSGVPARSTKD